MQKNKPHTIQTTFNYPITLYMHYIHRSKGFSVRRKSQTTGQRVEYSDEFAYMSYSITRRSSSINLLLVAGSTSFKSLAIPSGKASRSNCELLIFNN